MANIVEYYDSATVLTTTPVLIITIPSQTNMMRVKNDDAVDIILKFGASDSNNDMLIKAGDDLLTSFIAETSVYAQTVAGVTSANVFVQVYKG